MSILDELGKRYLQVMDPGESWTLVVRPPGDCEGSQHRQSALITFSREQLAAAIGGSPTSPPTPPQPVPSTRYRVSAGLLNVRSGPSIDYGIVRKLKQGSIVTAQEERADWIRIGAGEWVSALYVVQA